MGRKEKFIRPFCPKCGKKWDVSEDGMYECSCGYSEEMSKEDKARVKQIWQDAEEETDETSLEELRATLDDLDDEDGFDNEDNFDNEDDFDF